MAARIGAGCGRVCFTRQMCYLWRHREVYLAAETKLGLLCALLWMLLEVTGCGSGGKNHPPPPPLDEPLGPGEVRAGIITRESELLHGPEAHGWLGDYKLYNRWVAFVVEGIEKPRGFGSYGGSLLDADRVREEGAAGSERFQEMFPNLSMLTLRPTSAEVLSDGSDGEAVVRIQGVHQGIPLIDAGLAGGLQPDNLEITQDYILEPDRDYLRLRTRLSSRNTSETPVELGDVVLNGDTTIDFLTGKQLAAGDFVGGETFDYYAGSSPEVCYLYAGAKAEVRTSFAIQEVNLLVAGSGRAPPAREGAEPLEVERVLLVGDGGLDACLRILGEIRGTSGLGRLAGTVTDGLGNAQAGARVLARDLSKPASRNLVDQAFADDRGAFEMQLPAGSYQVVVQAEMLDDQVSEPLLVASDQTATVSFSLPRPAGLAYHCEGRDGEGNPTGRLPCKLSLQAGRDADRLAPVHQPSITFGAAGEGELLLPPGDWTVTLSRGFEYSIHRESVSVQAGETARVSGVLQRQVDTRGFIAADLHHHSSRSLDSTYDIQDKLAANICEGVELLVSTDHDCQTDFSAQAKQLSQKLSQDVDSLIRLVVGIEISPLYGHSTAFPLPTHATGWMYGQIPWTLYQDGLFVRELQFPEIWPRARDLGAQVINLAHPLTFAGYFSSLGFDPPFSLPRVDSLPAERFSTDFDTLELLNMKDAHSMLTKVLPLWSFLNNQGLFKTAIGVSDAHQRDAEAGSGRTLVASSSDDPGRIDLDQIWKNLKERRAAVVGGIWVRIRIGEGTAGDLVTASAPFEVHLHVEAADWVPVEQVTLIENGASAGSLPLQPPGQVDPAHPAVRFDGVVEVSPAVDSWYAAVAVGAEADRLDPVVRGLRPVGLTNAIQVDLDGDGHFDPPQP